MTTTTETSRTSSLGTTTATAAAASAALAATAPIALGWNGYLWLLAALTAAAAIALAVIDVRTLTLPNRLVVPLAAAAAVQVAASSLYTDVAGAAAAGGAAAVVFLAYLGMASMRWCGAGDAKFAGAVSLVAGLCVGLVAVYLVPVAVALSAVHILATRSTGGDRRHPHGPAIAVAATLMMVTGLVLAGSPAHR